MKQIFRSLLFLVCWIFSSNSDATIFMASDLGWKYVGQDSILVKLTIYKDCNGSSLPSSQTINFNNNSTGSLITSLTINTPVPVDVTPSLCSSAVSRCQNPSSTFIYGIQRYIYQGIVSLSSAGSCCEIRINFSACCRTTSITTGASNQNFYTQAVMNRCLSPHDNSPEFTEIPVNIICIGQDFVYTNGTVENDTNSSGGLLDSLGYEWTEPLQSSSTPNSWTGGYDYDKPIFYWGFPNSTLPFPRGFHLDPNTGELSFRPMKIESTIFCVLVSEYRNWVKIGEVRREMWAVVINCPNNHAPTLGPAPYSKEICAGSPVSFTFNTNDLDPNDTLTISWNQSIPGASWTTNNGLTKHPTANFTWTPTITQGSFLPYTFTVTVKDNACPIHGSSSHAYQIQVDPYFTANMTVADSGCNKYFFNVNVTPNVSPTYYWTGAGGLKSSNKSFYFSYRKPGIYPFRLIVTKLVCQKIIYDTNITNNFLYATLPNDTTICEGNNVNIISKVYNVKGNLKYHWNTGDTLHNSFTTGPLYSDSIIILTVNDSLHCPYTDSVKIKVRKLPKISVGRDTVICAKQKLLRYASILLDKNAKASSIKWYSTTDTFTLSIKNNITTFNSGHFICLVTDDLKCSSSDTFIVKTNPLPKVEAGNDTSVCIGRGKFHINGKPYSQYGFWTGTAVVEDNVNKTWYFDVTGIKSGNYPLIYHVSDSNHCSNEDTVLFNVFKSVKLTGGKYDSLCSGKGLFSLDNSSDSISGFWTGKGVFKNSTDNTWFFDPDGSGIVNLGIYGLVHHFYDTNQCYNDDTMNIKVYKIINVSAGKYGIQCYYNPPVQLIGSPPGGSWYIDGIGTGGIYFPSQADIGKHKIVYVYNLLCVNSDTTELEVIDRPKIAISTSTGKTSFCKEQGLIRLDASPFGGPYGGFWSGTGLKGNYFDPSTGNGNYDLIYHFTDMYGCSNEDTLVLSVQDPAVHILNTEKGICTGKAIELRAFKSSEYGLTWKSDSNSGGILTFDPSSDKAFYIPGNNDYLQKFFRMFVKTNDIICSKASDSITIKIGDYPKVDFDANKTSGIPPLHVSFIDKTVLAGSLITSYLWDFGDTSFSTVQYPVHDYHFTGTYPVKLRVVSEYGCEDSVIKYGFIKVTKTSVADMISPKIMIIPNPANDFFTIKLINSNEVIKSLVILNSVGQVIKSFNDLDVKEFKINKDKIINGIYFLKINFVDNKIIYSKILFE